ncbi:interferon-induced very large GTPase 1-like [Hemiscyllium ocellatum]|uniref:interferon-induced very large GTPase 1-like n=1 Tax=Hemiscyllium ocellatum TaxID=170820 RepID=UPI0029669304|nr:interferon-induced very large GTPase 1-like [Hemiscyllium ocellatum]
MTIALQRLFVPSSQLAFLPAFCFTLKLGGDPFAQATKADCECGDLPRIWRKLRSVGARVHQFHADYWWVAGRPCLANMYFNNERPWLFINTEPTVRAPDVFRAEGEVNLPELQKHEQSDISLTDSELGSGSHEARPDEHPKCQSSFPEADTSAQSDPPASNAPPEAGAKQSRVEDFLTELGLKTLGSKKLSLSNVLNLSTEVLQNKVPRSPWDIPNFFLWNLMIVNSKSRNFKYSLAEEGQVGKRKRGDLEFLQPEEIPANSYHPLDIMMAIFLCADTFLQQELMLKMSLCQFALPLLLPDGKEGCTFLLWALRSVVKKWRPLSLQASAGFREANMVTERVPTFSFLRLGTCSISKSKILNDALSTVEQHHNFFVHSGMECGNLPRRISDGLAELCWYLPSGSADLDLFPEPMAIFNLRGDGRAFHGQAQFLAKASSALFVFVDNVDGGVSSYLSSLVESVKNLFLILSHKDVTDETRSQVRELISSSVVRKECVLVLGKKNDAEFAQLLRTVLKELALSGNHQDEEIPTPPSQTTGKSLEDMAAIARRVGVKVDEDEEQCSLGQRKSEEILRSIKTEGIASFKKARMTFQGDTWQKISQLEKEACRLKKRGQMPTNQYINQLRERHKALCNAQRREGLSPDVKVFIEALTGWKGGERKHFLQWMKFGLDSSSRETLSVLRERYKALYESSQEGPTETLAEVWRQLQRLDRQITASSLGLEHFMREIGLIYERFTENSNVGKEEKSAVYRLPTAAANLMLDGFPLELIDGDVSNIPLRWVTAVLKAVEDKIGRETRVFVLTVLGVQSTGKSTLLNTMFGLQFAVSSGRCTRGAFMQLIRVTGRLRAELGCGYVMVIDTEGLKAPELSGVDESHEHDNELATLTIGLSDVTLVNLAMENSAEMKDVLQIAVHAFIRMKEVGKRPACYFVHQNVSDVSAHDQNMRGRKRLLEQLDTMTRAAAKMEKQERRFTKFTDVLEYDAKSNNWYIPGLWHGNPPMAAVNTGYSQKVFELRKMLFKCFSSQPPRKHKLSTVSEFVIWTQALWKAVKYENFIFSFRNSLVAEAYKELSVKYTDLEWQLRKDIHTFVEMVENKIANAKDDPEGVASRLKGDQEQLLLEGKQRALQELEDYFSNSNNAHLIEKYRAEFVSSIDSVIIERMTYADVKSKQAVQRWRNLQKMNEIKASYQSQIEGQVNKLLQKCRQEKRSLDDAELREEFEVMWEKTLSTLERGPSVRSDVVSDMETKLIQNMPGHSHLINETLAGKDWFQTEFGAFRVDKDHIDRKTVDDSPRAFVVRLLHRIFPKKCNISHRAEEWAMWCLEECSVFVGNMVQRRQDYDSTYFQELLRTVDEKIQAHNDEEFSFTERFKVDFSIHVCGVASGEFESMQNKFRKRNDVLELLNKEKMNYYNSFRNIYQEKDQTKQRAELFCKSCLEPALMNAVIKKLGPEIVDHMRYYGKGGKFKFRKNFQVALMLHLKEEDNFDNYHWYIQRTVSYEKTWLRKQVTEFCAAASGEQPLLCSLALDILKTFINLVKAAIKNVTSQTKEVAVSCVIQMLKEKLGSEIQIPDIQLAAITFGAEKINVENFTHEVTSFIYEVENCLVCQINSWANDADAIMKTLPVDPTEELYAMLSGCGTRCPFCGVLCDCTNAIHAQHSAEYHRPQGLTGYHFIKSRKLITENCTTLVASDTEFRNQDTKGEFWPYKNYRNLGTRYSCWNIIADTTIKTSAFWKWVFHTYNQQLAQKYTVLPADPISGWNISWGEIREDIENSYNVRIDEFC